MTHLAPELLVLSQSGRSQGRGATVNRTPGSLRAAHLLLFALALVVIEGAFRKWCFSSQTNVWSLAAYFSKDLAFAAILLCRPRAIASPALDCFGKWLFAGSGMLMVGMLLSSLGGVNPVGAAVTLRATLLLPWLACVAVRRLGRFQIIDAAYLLALLALLNCGLGVLQNRLPADHLLNRYVGSATEIAVLESGIRATGTFSFITGLEVLTFVGIWAGLVLLGVASHTWQQAGGLVAIFAAFGCGLTSVSRAPLIAGAGVLMTWAWNSRKGFKHAKALGLLLAILTLAISLGLAPVFVKLGRAVLARHETGGDTFVNRAFGQFEEALEAAALAPFGVALGGEQVAGNYAAKGEMTFSTFENQLPRLILETGVPGLLGFLTICAGSILSLQRAKKTLTNQQTRSMLLATQLLLVCLFYTNVVFNHTASSFSWLIFAAASAAAIPQDLPHSCHDSKRLLRSRDCIRRPYPGH